MSCDVDAKIPLLDLCDGMRRVKCLGRSSHVMSARATLTWATWATWATPGQRQHGRAQASSRGGSAMLLYLRHEFVLGLLDLLVGVEHPLGTHVSGSIGAVHSRPALPMAQGYAAWWRKV
jgi:hypothetical protein